MPCTEALQACNHRVWAAMAQSATAAANIGAWPHVSCPRRRTDLLVWRLAGDAEFFSMISYATWEHQRDSEELEENEHDGEAEQPRQGQGGARVWHQALQDVGLCLVAESPVAGDGGEVEGIQIHGVIYHLDLPQILEDEYGGWLSPRIVDDFTAYAAVCFREFGDRIVHWTSILEPNILAQGSYDMGIVPPNHCSYPFGYDCTVGNSTVEPYLFLHNTLLAHSSAVRLYRDKYQAAQKGIVGINLYSLCIYPLTDSVEDIQATERANDFLFGCILHPFLFGDYPDSMKKAAGSRLPSFSNNESELVTGAFDFIGLNHYSSIYASNNPNASKMPVRDQAADIEALFRETRDGPTSTQYLPGRTVDPQGLEHVLKYLQAKYGNISIYIQENGSGQADDNLMDVERIDFLEKYMASTLKAIRDGANVQGYSVWSFMDLYEIFGGYKAHFGLVSVNFRTRERQRQPRLSAHWYSDFLKNDAVIHVEDGTSTAVSHSQL